MLFKGARLHVADSRSDLGSDASVFSGKSVSLDTLTFALAFDARHDRLAWAGDDGNVYVRSTESLENEPAMLRSGTSAPVTALASGPDGAMLVVGRADGEVHLIREARAPLRLARLSGAVLTLGFDPASTNEAAQLVATTVDGALVLFPLPQRRALRIRSSRSMSFDRNPTLIADAAARIGPEAPYDSVIEHVSELLRAPGETQAKALREARRLLAEKLIERAINEVFDTPGDAVDAFVLAADVNPEIEHEMLTHSAPAWNRLCWFGALAERAAEVPTACDMAVSLAPDNGMFRNSRAVARALTGDLDAAAEDFGHYLRWAADAGQAANEIRQRRGWLEALQGGEQPIDSMVLRGLH